MLTMTKACFSSGVIDDSSNVRCLRNFAYSEKNTGKIRVSVVSASRDKTIPNKRGNQRRITLSVTVEESTFPGGYSSAKESVDAFLAEYGLCLNDFFVTQCEYTYSGPCRLSADEAKALLASSPLKIGEKERYRDFCIIQNPADDDDKICLGVKLRCRQAGIEWFYQQTNLAQNYDNWVNENIAGRLLTAAKSEFGSKEFWEYIAA